MEEKKYTIRIEAVSKRFNRQHLFRDISFTLGTGTSLSLTGPNGSGKSTLMQIIAGIQSPTRGTVAYSCNGSEIPKNEFFRHMGFISPVLNPYDELTGYENIIFSAGKKRSEEEINGLLEKFQLYEHRDKSLRFYSSGMKQRLKYILAVINDPPVLFFDEPGTNLDRSGKDILYSHIESIRPGKILFMATNEKEESSLCMEEYRIG